MTYELKSEGTGPLLDEPEVILVGSGLTLVYDKPLTVAAGWNSRAVPLTASGWTFREPKGRAATPEEFERALSSVAALRINGEFRTGTDTGWLAAVSMEPASPPTPERVSGPSTPLVDQVVPRTGGHLEYRNPGHPLDGFTINIPDGAYDGARRFHVSTRPAPFDAATPLISVENGGEYATTPMAVRIPVRVQSDEFAMAFFYDEKTGTREGLALLTQDSDSVTAMTLHFSDIFVAKIKKLLLPAKVSSGFLPGRDDWQMINYGSVVAPGGHCAGQSLSSMWYYCEKKLKGAPSLYGQYDHNAPGFKEHPSSKTPGFWEDDSLGVRLASTIQEDGWWNATPKAGVRKARDAWWELVAPLHDNKQDSLTFDAFRLAMNVTGEPQYVEVWGFDSDKNQVGHALVVYKVEDSRLYVADPNYPGGKDETGQRVDRYIQFDAAKGFLPFSASATSGSSPLLFTYVFFAGKSSVVGWDTFGRRWDEFVGSRNALPSENARLIGHDRFPEYELQMSAPTKTTKAFDYGTVQTIVDNAVVEAEMIEVRVRCGRYNYSSDPKTPLLCATSPMRVIVYRDGRPLAPGGGPLAPGETITLRGGKNELGFLVEARVDEEWVWVDYKDYDIWAGEADNPCDGVTVADLKKGPGLSKMNVVLCSAKCMPIGGPMPSDAVLQACIDGRDAPKTPPETVLPPPPPPPRSLLHGTWSGTWTNNRKNLDGKYQSGSGSISLSVDANGVVTGSWDGVTIENGRRTGNTMTWTSKTSDGWRRWDVTVQIQDDENTLVVSYTGHDRETMYKDGGNYSGSATYRRK